MTLYYIAEVKDQSGRILMRSEHDDWHETNARLTYFFTSIEPGQTVSVTQYRGRATNPNRIIFA